MSQLFRTILPVCLGALLAIPAHSRTIREFLASEPGRIFTLLPANTRLDLLDYYDSGQIVVAQNNLGDGTQLVGVDSTLLTIRTSDSRQVQMRLLVKARNDTVIAVVETVKTPVPDSRITFYNTRWEPLGAARHFRQPTLNDFFLPRTDKATRRALAETLPFTLIELAFDDKDRLVARHGLKQFLAKEDFDKFAPHMADSLVYVVSGTQIKPLRK